MIIERRKIFYIFSLLLIIPGIISLFINQLTLGIDFKGGSMLHLQMEQSVSAAEIRTVLEPMGLEKSEVQPAEENQYYIRTVELDQEQTRAVVDALTAKFGTTQLLGAESVGAVIGKELTWNALMALGLGMVLMLIYISVRFEWSFGVAAVLALFHNVLVVLGAFSLFHWEVNSPFIAAILTIIGYTINDTIVVFDRIRENMRGNKKIDYADLVNKSVLQTMNRSINTVLAAVITLVALLLLGGATIKYLILAMLIGFTVGAYTSVCIASPLWYEIKKAS